MANTYIGYENPYILRCKDHKDSVTCICLSNDGLYLYSGSKDGSIVKCKILHSFIYDFIHYL